MAEPKEKSGDDGWKRKLGEVQAKMERDADQRLAEVRDEYLSFNDDEKVRLKAWVRELAEHDEPVEVISYIKARVQFLIQYGDDVKEVMVSASSLRRAMPFWDRGEEYVPSCKDH